MHIKVGNYNYFNFMKKLKKKMLKNKTNLS